MMHILLCFLALLPLFASGKEATLPVTDVPAFRRSIHIGGTVREYRNVAIAIPHRTPLLDFAAQELSELLTAAGCKVTTIHDSGNDRDENIVLVLGSGIDISKLPPEGFLIVRDGKKVFIAGKDSDKDDPRRNQFMQWYARGTLTGVYDFLERFAGVRFFFPGECGTVVPRRNALALPDEIDLFDSPDNRLRNYSYYTGQWPKNYPEKFNGVDGKILSLLRLRGTSYRIPHTHGLASMGYIRRFGKTNPEYFALLPDGSRYFSFSDGVSHTGQLCFNSGIREEIYHDMVSYLRGEPASKRGVLGFSGNQFAWNHGAAGSGAFCPMPQDWLFWCCCEKCAKTAPGGRGESMTNPRFRRAINEFIWRMTKEYADRLTTDGVSGILIQMAYPPYNEVPECAIPENVRVMVAMTGGRDASDRRLEAWNKKLGHAPMIWTYPGKHMDKAIFDGIPAMSMKRQIEYYGKRKLLYSGVYHNSETDYWIFNHLEYYLFSKQMWNSGLDMKTLYDEYFTLMFGPGAKSVEKVYSRLEELWNTGILGKETETELGPVVHVPTLSEAWTKIYSPEEFRWFNARFDEAERLATGTPDALKRIRFIRRHMLGIIEKHATEFRSRNSLSADWNISMPGKVFLRPIHSGDCRPLTSVEVSESKDDFIFVFTCEEPEMKNISASASKPDSPEVFRDSNIEIFLNPSGDRKKYFHIAFSASGTLYDARCEVGAKPDYSWQSKAKSEIERGENFWKATLIIPKKTFASIREEGFPVNFGRTIFPIKPGVSPYRHWSPFSDSGFHDIENYGMLLRKKSVQIELVRNGDFSQGSADWKLWRQFPAQQVQKLDSSDFISGGASLLFENNAQGKIMNATQQIPLKPGCRYRISYDIKTELTDENDMDFGAAIAICTAAHGHGAKRFPAHYLRGDSPWQRLSFEFTTDAETRSDEAEIVLWLWGATGMVRFDRVSVVEL